MEYPNNTSDLLSYTYIYIYFKDRTTDCEFFNIYNEERGGVCGEEVLLL